MAGAGTGAPEQSELVFQQAVEGLFLVGLKGRVTPQLQAQLKEAGLDLSQPLAPAYPRAAWSHFITLAARGVWPDTSEEQAYHALGRQLLLGYGETLIGRTLAPILRLIGPRRTLERMTRNFRSGGSYNLTRVTEVGPGKVLFWMNEPFLHPAYVVGILEAALQVAGARALDIQVHARDAKGCTYRIRWEV